MNRSKNAGKSRAIRRMREKSVTWPISYAVRDNQGNIRPWYQHEDSDSSDKSEK
jgi:hypothetical protein